MTRSQAIQYASACRFAKRNGEPKPERPDGLPPGTLVYHPRNTKPAASTIQIPKTKAQNDFEANVKYLVMLFSELEEREQKMLLDLAVFLANE